MTAATTFPAPAISEAAPRTAAGARLWRTGAVSGIVAGIATSAVAGVAHALDVSLRVSGSAIPVIGFAQVTFVAAIIGTILAVVLSRRAGAPRRTFVTTTIALTALSIVPDVIVNAGVATKGTLALTHVVAAAIVIPALASRLTD